MSELGPNAGSAHITVKPSLRGWSEDVRRQLKRELANMPALELAGPDRQKTEAAGKAAGDQFAGGFDRAVRKRIAGALDALPKTEIGVATTEAEQRIKDLRAELETLSKKRIGIDVDAAAAVARLHEIQTDLEALSAQSANINVKADTILASAQLAAVHREVNALDRDDVNIKVDVDRSGVASLTGALSGLAGMASGATSQVALLATAGLALIPVAAVLATIAATAAGTLVAAGGGIGVLFASVLGNIIPVIKAQGELKQKQQEAASAASAYATAQNGVRTALAGLESAEISAGRAIADAQRGVADARRNASRSIESAEEAVAGAQQRAKDAQDALNTARDTARERLAAYADQLRSAALEESGAALSVTQAQEALNAVLSDPTATQLQIDLARQALAEAQFGYDQSTKSRKELRKQAQEDRKAGVAGDQGVKDAKEQLAQANLDVAHAEQDLARTRADAARSIAAAQRNLARAQADGARAVAAAQAQVAQAQQAAAEAGQRNADAQAEVAKRLAKMSGPAAVFVRALAGAKDAWQGFLKATARASFGVAVKALQLFTDLLPQLEPLARHAAHAVGTLLDDFGKFASGKEGQSFLHWMEKKAPGAIVTIGRAIGNIAVGIGGFVGALMDKDTGFLGLMRRFADFGRNAGKNKGLKSFFDYAQRMAPVVAHAIGAIADAIGNIVKGAAPVAGIVVKGITLLAEAIAKLDPQIITAIVGALVAIQLAAPIAAAAMAILEASPVVLVIGALVLLGAELYLIYKKVGWFREGLKRAWGIVGHAVQVAWKTVIQPALKGFAGFVTDVVIPAIKFLATKVIKPYFQFIGDFIAGIWKRFIKPAFQAWWWIMNHTLIPVVKYLWEKVVRPIFTAIGDFMHDTVVPRIRSAADAIARIWNRIATSAVEPIQFVVDMVYNNGLRKVINAIPGVTDVEPLTIPTLPTFSTGDSGQKQQTFGPGFAAGGVLPGWTPGRDVHRFVSPTAGVLNLSGGEAVMRPEFTAAAGGPRGIDFLNRLARAGRLKGLLGSFLSQSHLNGGVIYVDGEPMSRVAAAQLAVAEHASGIPMRVIQGSYQAPSSYSGTSHTGGGVMDTSPGSFAAQSWLRKVAFAAWARNIPGAAYAGSGAHVHSVSLIDPTVTNRSQVASYLVGGDGLGGPDYGPRPGVSASLLQKVASLANSPFAGVSATGSASVQVHGGNPFTRFLGAIDAVKDFAKRVPSLLDQLGSMKAWGKVMLTGIRSLGGQFREWVNGKIPGPGPMPDVFDSGGLALGRGYLRKATLQPERVLSPAQTAAFERQVATLDNWDRTVRTLAGHRPGPNGPTRLQVESFRIVDWDKGLAEIEYMATDAAEQVYASHDGHHARVGNLDAPYAP